VFIWCIWYLLVTWCESASKNHCLVNYICFFYPAALEVTVIPPVSLYCHLMVQWLQVCHHYFRILVYDVKVHKIIIKTAQCMLVPFNNTAAILWSLSIFAFVSQHLTSFTKNYEICCSKVYYLCVLASWWELMHMLCQNSNRIYKENLTAA